MERRGEKNAGRVAVMTLLCLCMVVAGLSILFQPALTTPNTAHGDDVKDSILFFPYVRHDNNLNTTVSPTNLTKAGVRLKVRARAADGDLLGPVAAISSLGPLETKTFGAERLPKKTGSLEVAPGGRVIGSATFKSPDGKKTESLPAVRESSKRLDFPGLSRENSQFRWIVVFNPNAAPCAMDLIAMSKGGVEMDRKALPPLAPMESRRIDLADAITAGILKKTSTVRIDSNEPVMGAQFVDPPDGDLLGLPAVTWDTKEWFLPVMRKAGNLRLWTKAFVFNPSGAPSSFKVEAFDASDKPLGVVHEDALLPGASRRVAFSARPDQVPPDAAFLRVISAEHIVAYEVIGVVDGPGRTAILGFTSRAAALSGLDIRVSGRNGSLLASWDKWLKHQGKKTGNHATEKENASRPEKKPDADNTRRQARVDICGDITTNTTWTSGNVYVLTCHITIHPGATLTIQPGTVIKQMYQGWNFIFVEGGLKAQGTAGSPVVFTSYRDDTHGGDTNGDGSATSPAPDDWGRVEFKAGSTGTLSYALFGYGGWNSDGMLQSVSSQVALDHVTIQKSSHHGLYSNNATVNVTNSTISDNQLLGLCYNGLDPAKPLVLKGNSLNNNASKADASNVWDWNVHAALIKFVDTSDTSIISNPSKIILDGNTGTGNPVNGIGMSGTVNKDMVLEYKGGLPVVISRRWMDLVVGPSATLTLSPGMVMKMGPGLTSDSLNNLIVKGSLVAEGTDSLPILFTSLLDDSVVGDTNNDGSATTPAAGLWGAVYFAAGSHGKLSRATLKYGGGQGWLIHDVNATTYGVVHSLSSDVAPDHVTLNRSGQHGFYASNATVNITNCTISASWLNGVKYDVLDASKSLILSNNLFKDNGQAGQTTTFDNLNAGYFRFDGNPPNITLQHNSASGNEQNCFWVGGTLTGNLVWDNTDSLPLLVEECWTSLVVAAGATLQLQPGSVMKFMPGACGSYGNAFRGLVVKGGLVAQGTTQLPIAFTSLYDDAHGGDTNNDADATAPAPGDWGCIGFETGSSGSISNAFIGYGGTWGQVPAYGWPSGMVDSRSGEVTLDHVTLQKGGRNGLFASNACVKVTNSTISGNTWNGLHYEGFDGSRPLVVTDNVIKDNGHPENDQDYVHRFAGALVLNGNPPQITFQRNTASGNTNNSFCIRGAVKKDLVWENGDSPPLTLMVENGNDLTVDAGATLTLQPGTIVKFRDGWWDYHRTQLIVKGGLMAEGTAASPIAFTSQRDDVHGGDSNGDGSSSAQPGDWGSIRFEAGSHGRISSAFIGYGAGSRSAGEAYNMVHSASSDVILDHVRLQSSGAADCSSCGGNSAFYGFDAGPIVRNSIISGNVVGAATNNGNFWADARTCYWGDPSGPFHATLNPNGKGDKIGEKVLFHPWAEDPSGTLTQRVTVSVLGPSRASPGESVDYAVTFNTGRAINNAVLVARLPVTAEYELSGDGGIYMYETNQVFWKLGNLKAYDTGTRRVKVRYLWGVPNGFLDGVGAILGGANLDMGSYSFDTARYLNYTPLSIGQSTIMTEGQIADELASYPQVKTLHDAAVADGFKRVGGMETVVDAQTFTLIILLNRDKGAKIDLRRNHADDNVTSNYFSLSTYAVKDVSGGMSMGLDTDAVDFSGDWTLPPGSTLDGMAWDDKMYPPEDEMSEEELAEWLAETLGAGSLTRGVCMRNCLLKAGGKWAIKKLCGTIDAVMKAKDCTKALLNGDPGSMASCMKTIEKVAETCPVLGEIKDGWTCFTDCVIGENFEKYACSGSLYKVEPAGWTWNPQSWTEEGRKRMYKYYKCSETTKMWIDDGDLYCYRGFVAQDGVKDSEGKPCVPANEMVAFAYGGDDVKVPSANTTTVVQPAHDPNEKKGPSGNLLPAQKVTYTVSFENEGSGMAYGVFVLDNLSELFDESTLDITGPGEYLSGSRTIMWDVGDLNPKGETGSKGDVSFTVRLNKGLADGTVVSNKAVVHFPSVPEETPTNTVVNTVRRLLAKPKAVSTVSGKAVAIVLAGDNVGQGTLTYSVTVKPMYGTLSGSPPNLTYTPLKDFIGTDRFSFKVSSGESDSEPADVTITVNRNPADVKPPTVIWTSPYNGEAVKGAGKEPAYTDSIGPVYLPSIQIEFSEAVRPASVSKQTIQLVDPLGRPVKATVAYDAQSGRASILVRQPWQVGAHTATVKAGVVDLNGNKMAKSYSWKFTTSVPVKPKSTVSILAMSPQASEAGKKAQFRVTREGEDMSTALKVYYAVGGTATNGTDYSTLPGFVKIGAGKSSALITITPTNDTAKEGTETVKLTISKKISYKIGTPGLAIAEILDND